MTLEEAEQVARIASTCDGGCSHCIPELVGRLNAAFPAFVFEYREDERWHEPDPHGFNEDGFKWPVIAVSNAQTKGA
jgi:hypothetical protein